MIRLAAFDMDGTLVDARSSWAFVHDHFGESNSEALRLFLDNRIDDAEFIRRDIQLWWKHAPNLTVQEIDEILGAVPLMPGAKEMFEGLHQRGIMTAIVSGGIDLLARRIARELGIEYVLANGFRVDATGRLTGEGLIRVPIKSKEEVLERVQAQLGVRPEQTAAVGNSEIDVGLFRRSRIGIAFEPEDDVVRRHATAVITDRDLRHVLEVLDASVPDSSPKQGF
ncbi:MAG TPA: HAD-IB family phosphatase [Thermoplasmata archaeon]|nr:HAD-IB family phosphatase [Thermoplasmata archaeon]